MDIGFKTLKKPGDDNNSIGTWSKSGLIKLVFYYSFPLSQSFYTIELVLSVLIHKSLGLVFDPIHCASHMFVLHYTRNLSY